jgi:hypothetical protein
MNRSLFIFLSAFITTCNLTGQNIPKEFNIGNFINVYSNDSIAISFNCTGTITDLSCADFIRKGKIDSININVTGNFKDYYPNGVTAFEGTMINDYLEGEGRYYHLNGVLKSCGHYTKDRKVGLWFYYYENTNLEKIINFIDDQPFVVEYYDRYNIPRVVNGAGEYYGEFYPYKTCTPLGIAGQIENGKINGVWTLVDPKSASRIAQEKYLNGVFQKGVSYGAFSGRYSYKKESKIVLDGYIPNEELVLDINFFGCPGNSFWPPTYNSNSLNDEFYPVFLKHLQSELTNKHKNQWFIVGIKVNTRNTLTSVNIKSSINDYKLELTIQNILESMTKWQAAIIDYSPIETNLYFSILIRNNKVIIPVQLFHDKNYFLFK